MKCPFCSKGNVNLSIEKRERIFRKEEFEIFEYHFRCNNCNEDFTTTEIDTINTNQVYNKYREKYSIPFPEQLIAIREHYNLSSAKMSGLLGFGPNQYRLYEGGELPAGGNATVLGLIVNPASFKEIVLRNKAALAERKFNEILEAIEKKKNTINKFLENILFPTDIIPDRYRGFKLPQFEKLAHMVLFFITNAPFKVRLNKLLYYADFTNYKYTGFSISGCRYAAIDMGSVPDQFAHIFGLLESEKYLTTELVKIDNKEHEKFTALKKFNKDLFNESELSNLKLVLEKFKNIPTQKLMKISHDEKAWLENISTKSLIDYSIYAPQLNAL